MSEKGDAAREPSLPSKKGKQSKITELAEVGALPPMSDDDEETGAREVEVMSEAPEIDTTRFDGPPLVGFCGLRCQPLALKMCVVITSVLFLPATTFAICVLVQDLRETSAVVEKLVNTSMTLLCNTGMEIC